MSLFKKEKINSEELYLSNLPADKLYQQGLIALLDNNIDNALKLLKISLKKDSTNIDAYIRVGNIYREKEDYSRAIMIHNEVLLRENISKNEILFAYNSLIEDFYWCKKNNIIPPLKLSPIIKRANTLILNDIVSYLIKFKFYNTVLDLYKNLSKSKIDIPVENIYFLAGIEDFKEENFGEAIRLFNESLNIKKSVDAQLYLGFAYFEIEDYNKAYKNLSPIIHKFPEFLKDYEEILYKTNRYSEISSILSKILEENPNDVNILIHYADFKNKIKKEEEALDLLKKAMDLEPKKTILHYIKQLFILGKNSEIEDIFLNQNFEIPNLKSETKTCNNCGKQIEKNFTICLNCGHYL